MYVYSYIHMEYDYVYVHLFIYSYTHIMYGIICTYNYTYIHINICIRYDYIYIYMYIHIFLHRDDKWLYIYMNVRIFIWNIMITFDYILYWHCDSSTHKLWYFIYVYICFIMYVQHHMYSCASVALYTFIYMGGYDLKIIGLFKEMIFCKRDLLF